MDEIFGFKMILNLDIKFAKLETRVLMSKPQKFEGSYQYFSKYIYIK